MSRRVNKLSMVAAMMAPVRLQNRPLSAADAAASKARATALAQAKAKARATARVEQWAKEIDAAHAEWAREGPNQSARHRCTTLKQILVDAGFEKKIAASIAVFVG